MITTSGVAPASARFPACERGTRKAVAAQTGEKLSLECATAIYIQGLTYRIVRNTHAMISTEVDPQPIRYLYGTPHGDPLPVDVVGLVRLLPRLRRPARRWSPILGKESSQQTVLEMLMQLAIRDDLRCLGSLSQRVFVALSHRYTVSACLHRLPQLASVVRGSWTK